MLSFFPLDVLDEIWDVIESVSEGFLTYSYDESEMTTRQKHIATPGVYLIRIRLMPAGLAVSKKSNG